jgi:hypothetical protein
VTEPSWVGIATAVGGGLGTGFGIGVWLVKQELSRVRAVMERVPEKPWFERMERKLDAFDPTRAVEQDHQVREHEIRLVNHEGRLLHVEHRLEDHEVRLRAVEVK